MEETFANMTAFFDGKEIGIWQPTKKGDYQWHGEKPKKGYVPRE